MIKILILSLYLGQILAVSLSSREIDYYLKGQYIKEAREIDLITQSIKDLQVELTLLVQVFEKQPLLDGGPRRSIETYTNEILSTPISSTPSEGQKTQLDIIEKKILILSRQKRLQDMTQQLDRQIASSRASLNM